MINREDMLALTRRMTVKRTSMTRIAGGYLDMDGYIDGTFNTGFLKLSPDEKEKNLQIAKVIPMGDYAVYVFHDRYDIPAKGKDHVRQGESEEMFEYLICAICPVS